MALFQFKAKGGTCENGVSISGFLFRNGNRMRNGACIIN